MTRHGILLSTILTILLTSGCQYNTEQNLYIHGQSSIHSTEWKSKVQINKTTEQDLINLLGQPATYYHRMSTTHDKYMLYSSIATVLERREAVLQGTTEKQTVYEAREWFLVSNGVLIKHISPEDSNEDPDLNGFIASAGSDFPYCSQINSNTTEGSSNQSLQVTPLRVAP